MLEILRYVTESGKDVFGEWLDGLRDIQAAAKIIVRIDRLSTGNVGDCKPVAGAISEIRIDWGPGYRVYYAMVDRTTVLLLCGGDKRKQAADIKRAVRYWEDFQRRTKDQ